MKTITRAFGAALVFAAALAQQGCDNSYGIYEEVQKEREQKGQEIFRKKAVADIVAANGNFYASTAMLYSRAVTAAPGSAWTKVEVGGYSDYFVYGLAAIGTHVYVSIAAGNAFAGVYDLSGGGPIAGAPATGEKLFVANDQLFLTSHAVDSSNPVKSTYSLYHLNGASFELVQNFAPAVDKAIRGVAYDRAANTYYFASEDLLVRGGNADGSGAAAVAGFTKTIRSATSGPNVAYIGTTDGYLYRYRSGAEDSAQVTTIPVTAAVEVPLGAASWKLLVGTGTGITTKDSLGYFEAAEDISTALASTTFGAGESGAVATSSSIYSTTVGDLAVNAFLYYGDLTDGTLLVGLSSYTSTGIHFGLYASTWDGSAWSGWKAE
jgi:hypothetical protein